MSETMNGAFRPCHSARCEWNSVSPVMVRTPALIGLSTQPSVNGRTREVRPGSAAGSQSATGASVTCGMGLVPSINAPKTIFAE